MAHRATEPFLHPLVWLILALIALVALARQCAPARDRQRAMREFRVHLGLTPFPGATGPRERRPKGNLGRVETSLAPNLLFESWYLDDVERGECAFDFSPERRGTLSIHGRGRRLSNGTELLLSAQDLAFVAWVSYTYRINPHFLLGVMVAESNGNCAAVSHAGAQGCFQITYQQGAGQLQNSYPDRVSSWYWAPRSNEAGRMGQGDARKGYWPDDLYIPPDVYFGVPAARAGRQFRMTVDPVATLATSDRFGDVEVSSVANFSFGSVGAGLYFHYLNHYLYSHVPQVGDVIRDLVSEPGAKAWWMAAAYNQGGPRTMIALGKWGADDIWRHTDPSVLDYAAAVSDYCVQLQSAPGTYSGAMTYGEFSDFLEQLRWTYSSVPVDWDAVRAQVRAVHFTHRDAIDLNTEWPAVFRTMVSTDARLQAEAPVLDHHVTF